MVHHELNPFKVKSRSRSLIDAIATVAWNFNLTSKGNRLLTETELSKTGIIYSYFLKKENISY